MSTAALEPTTAWAKDPSNAPRESKTLAIFIEGQEAAAVREDLAAAAPESVTVVESRTFQAALRKAGQPKLGFGLSAKKGRDKLLMRVRKALVALKADAGIVGVVQRTAGKKRVYLVWVDAAKDAPPYPLDGAVELGRTADDRKKALATALEAPMRDFAPPVTAQPEPAKSTPEDGAEGTAPETGKEGEDEDEDPHERVRHASGSSLFSVEVGFELGGRRFTYSDGLSPDTRRDYKLFGAPMASIQLEVYPAAGTGIRFLKDLGITAGYARAFGVSSSTEGGDPASTTYQRISAGLRGRLPLWGPEGPVIGFNGGARILTFEIEEPVALKGEVPDVSYIALRGGVDGRFPIGPVALLAGFDWLFPLKSGEVYDRFTGASVQGLAVTAGLAARVGAGFEVRLWGEYSRFFSNFDPVLGDAHVAGGALDELVGIRLAGAYVE
jgi:hypothetical protein